MCSVCHVTHKGLAKTSSRHRSPAKTPELGHRSLAKKPVSGHGTPTNIPVSGHGCPTKTPVLGHGNPTKTPVPEDGSPAEDKSFKEQIPLLLQQIKICRAHHNLFQITQVYAGLYVFCILHGEFCLLLGEHILPVTFHTQQAKPLIVCSIITDIPHLHYIWCVYSSFSLRL